MLSNYKIIFWDFDGVILNSMEVRDFGFREVLKEYPTLQVEQLINYHRKNGGLSRYVKIRYFFEKILNSTISEEQLNSYANEFSKIMKVELINPDNLISDSLTFIKNNYENYQFHIVSGSDQEELKFLCEKLNINKYFNSIHGSPTPKNELVENLLLKYNYSNKACCLIGDSINDLEAAKVNDLQFFGYNNDLLLKDVSKKDYIFKFSEIITNE